MARLTTLFVVVVVFLASAQCFARCLDGACQQKHSCHSRAKTCSHPDLVADDGAASTGYSLRAAAAVLPVVRIAAPVLPAASFSPQPPISPPSAASLSIAVLKI
jgi:hypothetical protein